MHHHSHKRSAGEMEELFRRHGLKVTPQRVAMFAALDGNDGHPDVETVYQNVLLRVPSISRDTVYRTLATFEDKGLIRRAEILSGPSRFDANTEPHHHFVCTACGQIKDFNSEALDRLTLPASVKKLGSVDFAQVQACGICKDCQKHRTT